MRDQIEAGLEGNAQQRQSHRQQVHLRSQHPRVQHFIGEMVEFRQAGQPAARKSVVAGWSTVKPSRAIRSGVAHQVRTLAHTDQALWWGDPGTT